MTLPATLRRRPGLSLAVFAALTAVGSVTACRARLAPPSPAVVDPQLVSLHPAAFRTKFDGGGDVNLGVGWYGPQQSQDPGPWSSYSWAARTATLYFGTLSSTNLELSATVAPFVYAGAPRQELTATLNGTPLPTLALVPDWQRIRVALPSMLLRGPINRLELRFAYAAAPSAVSSSVDTRELAAVFHELSIGEPATPPDPSHSEVRGGASPRETLVVGREGLSLPLAPGRRHLFRAFSSTPSNPGIGLKIDVLAPSGAVAKLWRGAAREIAEKSLRFETLAGPPSRLFLGLDLPPGTPADSAVRLDAELRHEASPPPGSQSRPPDVFVYLIDTLRADALGIYGSSLQLSPRIDTFARDAVTYLAARSASSWTLPATASIFSGVYPSEHAMGELGNRLDPGAVPWLPETLSNRGYEAVAFSQWPLGRSYGLESGFADYFLDVRLTTKSRSEAMRRLFWEYLLSRRRADRPLFAYVHVSDPHAVYDPPGPDRWLADLFPGKLLPEFYNPRVFLAENLGGREAERKHLRALYDGEVHYADRQFGAFLDALKYLDLYDKSLIVLLSDHGEEFYEHGGFDHGRTLYDEVLRVPLLIKFPGSQGGAGRVQEPVSTIEVAPTIAAVLGLPADARYRGRALPKRDPDAGSATRRLFSEVKVRKSQTPIAADVDLSSLLMAPIKCIRTVPAPPAEAGERSEAYDLAKDPDERSPLPPADSRAAECLDELRRWTNRAGRPHPKKEAQPLPPEEIRRLRALGYLD